MPHGRIHQLGRFESQVNHLKFRDMKSQNKFRALSEPERVYELSVHFTL